MLELHVYNTFSNAIATMQFKKDNVIRYKYNKNEDLEYGLLKSPKILLFRK